VETATIRGLLLGLANEENDLLGLGLLKDLDPATRRLVCLTPFRDRGAVRIVHFGSLRLEPSGEELGEVEILTVKP
jgi:polynucleotide 5'-kinase involved in rRNA processing